MALTDEMRKKAAADSIRRANEAIAAGAGVRAAPGGVAPPPRTAKSAAKESAKAAVAGKLVETKMEEPVGFWGDMMNTAERGFKATVGSELPSAGDYDPKLGQAADLMKYGPVGMIAGAQVGALGLLDTFANRDGRLGESTPLTTAATTIVDTASVGSLNKVGAAVDTMYGNAPRGSSDLDVLSAMWQRETGGDMATYAEQLDARALEQEEIRAANPITALGGDVLGSVLTGSLIAKAAYAGLAAKSGPVSKFILGNAAEGAGAIKTALTSQTTRALGFGSLLGGGEAFAYSMNKFGDIKRAGVDSVMATLGGFVLGGAATAVVKGGAKVTGSHPMDHIKNEVGKAYMANINVDNAIKGLPPATPSDVAKQLEALGPDATLMDAFPSLKKFANYFIGTDAAKTDALPLYDLLRQRASFMADIYSPDKGIRSLFGEQTVRSLGTFKTAAKNRLDALQPRYSEVYAANRDWTFSGKKLAEEFEATLPPASRRKEGQVLLMKNLSDQIKFLQKQSTAAKTGGTPVDDLTLEQVVGVKQWLQDAIGQKTASVGTSTKVKPLTNLAIRDFTRAAKYVEGILDEVEGMAPLNAVYGNVANLSTAYEAGRKAFSSAAKDSADVAAFMTGDTSAAGRRAFIEGSKYHLFNLFSKASTPEAIEKIIAEHRPTLDKMSALFGKEATAEMVQAATAMVTKVKTVRGLQQSVEAASVGDMLNTGTSLKPMLDAGIAVAGVPGLTSKAAGLGALGRLVAGGPDATAVSNTSQYGSDILTRMGEGASDAFKELQRMTERSALASGGYRTTLPAGAGAAAGAAMNESRNRDGVLPQ